MDQLPPRTREPHLEIRPADDVREPDAYLRARRLATGDVDQALAETMRLPGAANAQAWVAKARRYVAAHRALDETEIGGPARSARTRQTRSSARPTALTSA